MKRGVLIAVGVVCLVALGGCLGPLSDQAADDSSEADATTATATTPATPTDAPEPTETATPTETPTETATPTETPTATPESWSEPQQPNRPLQNNTDENSEPRIKSIEVTGSGGGADGSTSFHIDVTANTSMPAVDPPEHGTPRGEPFFLVYLDATLDEDDRFVYVEGDLVERSPELAHESDGEYTLTVPEGAFEENGAEPGEHELLIMLMDEDKDWDDIYGLERVTVEYDPGEE